MTDLTSIITIAIPVLNGEKYLKEAIESAINQITPADEILVFVHDTSDESILIARGFGQRIRIVEENTNLNIGQAWNRLYELSQSDYVVMLHADDKLHESAIENFKYAIEKNPLAGMIFGILCLKNEILQTSVTNFSSEHIPRSNNAFEAAMQTGFLPGCSGLCLKRDVIIHNKFSERLNIILDVEFFNRICLCIEVVGLPFILATYRVHAHSTSQISKIKHTVDDYKLLLSDLKNISINLSGENASKYSGSILRRFASYYSSLIHAYEVDMALDLVSTWKWQISENNQVYRTYLSKFMRIFIEISLIDCNYGFFLSFILARLHRFISRKHLHKTTA